MSVSIDQYILNALFLQTLKYPRDHSFCVLNRSAVSTIGSTDREQFLQPGFLVVKLYLQFGDFSASLNDLWPRSDPRFLPFPGCNFIRAIKTLTVANRKPCRHFFIECSTLGLAPFVERLLRSSELRDQILDLVRCFRFVSCLFVYFR